MGAMKMVLRGVGLVFPSSSVVQLHPVVFSVFDFPSVLQSLSEQVAQVVVVGSVLEAEVPDVAQVLAELFCRGNQYDRNI